MRTLLLASCLAVALAALPALVGCDGSSNETTDMGGDACNPTCRTGYVCDDGECVEAVDPNGCNPACPDGEVCQNGECVDDGATDSCNPPCRSGYKCVAGVCEEDAQPVDCNPACADTEVCLGGDCHTPTDDCDPACASDEYCVDGECLDENGDPVGGDTCNPPCRVGDTCVDGQCVDMSGCNPACEDGFECQNGECIALTGCAAGCADDEMCVEDECQPGWTREWQNPTCFGDKPMGAACEDHCECDTGYCYDEGYMYPFRFCTKNCQSMDNVCGAQSEFRCTNFAGPWVGELTYPVYLTHFCVPVCMSDQDCEDVDPAWDGCSQGATTWEGHTILLPKSCIHY